MQDRRIKLKLFKEETNNSRQNASKITKNLSHVTKTRLQVQNTR